MKRRSKSLGIIVLLLILAFSYTVVFGIKIPDRDSHYTYIKGSDDIRLGIDIKGGVDVVFSPPSDAIKDMSKDEMKTSMKAAEEVIKLRLIGQNITDHSVYTDTENYKVVVRFPWKSDEKDFDPKLAIDELGKTAELKFVEGEESTGTVVITGADIAEASMGFQRSDPNNQNSPTEPVVQLKLKPSGKDKFAEATGRLQGSKISIWLDDQQISAPTVSAHITDGSAIINGMPDSTTASKLANQINSGALPFKLETTGYSTINPTLGQNALDAMVIAGVIALALVCVFMFLYYRLPGFVACIALIGQVTGSLACVSGYLPFIPSFTLTLPGIAGIILSIGMGVDANILTFERIKDELRAGKTIDRSIDIGNQNSFAAILDGNVTTIFVALILMGVFGPLDSLIAAPFKLIFGILKLGPSTAGAIYSFGFTLLVGVIFNFIMAVSASRLMLQSMARFKPLRKRWLYGGAKNEL